MVTGEEPVDTYVSGSWGRHATEGTTLGGMPLDSITKPVAASPGPDEVAYRYSFDEPTAIAGPLALTLWASTTATDVDFFVSVIDVGPDGTHQCLQRGYLRASHRALDDGLSDRIPAGALAGEIYRPYHPHTNTGPVTPGALERYDIETLPLGHVFREGHQLELKVHAPPCADKWWLYGSARPAGQVASRSEGPAFERPRRHRPRRVGS